MGPSIYYNNTNGEVGEAREAGEVGEAGEAGEAGEVEEMMCSIIFCTSDYIHNQQSTINN